MDEELKKRIEAILFSIGSKINVNDIMRMTREKDKAKVVSCLIELKNKYNSDENNSLMIIQDGDDWKLTIKDQYIEVAKEIGVETELKKTVLETLAVIAYKNPCLQSEVIKIRTNKAYDHLLELEQLGYIEREKSGRTKKIKLTSKFFDYFDLPPESLREKFKNVTQMEQGIKVKERQIHEITEMKREKIEEMKREDDERLKKNIFVSDPNNPNIVDIVSETKEGLGLIVDQKLGGLSVVEEYEAKSDQNPTNIDDQTNNETSEKTSNDEISTDELQIISTDYSFDKVSEQNKSESVANDNLKNKYENNFGKANNTEINDNDLNRDEVVKTDDEDVNNNIDYDEVNNDKNWPKQQEQRQKDELKEMEQGSKQKTENEGHQSDLTSIKEIGPENHGRSSGRDSEEYQKNPDVELKNKIDDHKETDEKANEVIENVEILNVKEDDEEIQQKDYTMESKLLKEEKLFNMDDMPNEIMDKIEKRAEEITGEIKERKNDKEIKDETF